MPSSTLFLNSVSASAFNAKPSKAERKIQPYRSRIKLHDRHHRDRSTRIIRCGCSGSASSSSSITGYDLYELLGVDSSSDQSQIKQAYRALQKRCHPDIAGPTGHDMAIILNEVYSLLSDPASRSAYDQEQAKISEFRGYTGKPLYSTWFGSEAEQRAVFVDEVKCVGCLKCALFANKTFAIESVYGRARVVAQWADPEDKILAAIEICPVDCISIVERSNLAALEFLMSKQPRGSVRMTSGNTGGVRVSNIFAEIDKFQRKFHEMKDKVSSKQSQDSDLQRDSRTSAVHGIRSISNWWYWRAPTTAGSATSPRATTLMILTTKKKPQPNTKRLQEAAANLRARETGATAGRTTTSYKHNDEEYWTPTLVLPSPSNVSNATTSSSEPPPNAVSDDSEDARVRTVVIDDRKRDPMALMVPYVMAFISAAVVGSSSINSSGLQILLAGATWFVIGTVLVGFVEVVGSKELFRR